MLPSSVPWNSGQPNARDSRATLIGSIAASKRTYISSVPAWRTRSVSIARPPSKTGCFTGSSRRKCRPVVANGSSAGPSSRPQRRPESQASRDTNSASSMSPASALRDASSNQLNRPRSPSSETAAVCAVDRDPLEVERRARRQAAGDFDVTADRAAAGDVPECAVDQEGLRVGRQRVPRGRATRCECCASAAAVAPSPKSTVAGPRAFITSRDRA